MSYFPRSICLFILCVLSTGTCVYYMPAVLVQGRRRLSAPLGLEMNMGSLVEQHLSSPNKCNFFKQPEKWLGRGPNLGSQHPRVSSPPPAPGSLMPTCGLCRHLCSCTHTQRYTHTVKNNPSFEMFRDSHVLSLVILPAS